MFFKSEEKIQIPAEIHNIKQQSYDENAIGMSENTVYTFEEWEKNRIKHDIFVTVGNNLEIPNLQR